MSDEIKDPGWKTVSPLFDKPRTMLEVGVEGDRFNPHPENSNCVTSGCVPEAEPAAEELAQIKAAIHEILTQKHDNICWMDIYTQLGKFVGIDYKPEILPREWFLKNCQRFYDSLATHSKYDLLDEEAVKAFLDAWIPVTYEEGEAMIKLLRESADKIEQALTGHLGLPEGS